MDFLSLANSLQEDSTWEIDSLASETLPSERQGSNLILLVQQDILTPEFLSSHEA